MGYAAIALVRKRPSHRHDPYTYNTERRPAGLATDQAWQSILFDRDVAALTAIVRSDKLWVQPKCPECGIQEIQVKGRCKRCYDVRFIRLQREQARGKRLD